MGVLAAILILAAGAVCLTNAYGKGEETIKNNGKKPQGVEDNKETGKNEEDGSTENGDIIAAEKING